MDDGKKITGVVIDALDGVLLRDLARIVVEYSRRPGHKWITDPTWLPPNVDVSPDGRTASKMLSQSGVARAVRGCETFEFGARRWSIRISAGPLWVGVVNPKAVGSSPPWLLHGYDYRAYSIQHGYDYPEDHCVWFSLRALTHYRGPGKFCGESTAIKCDLCEGHELNIEFEAQVEKNSIQVTICGDHLPPMQVPNLRDYTPYACNFWTPVTIISDHE